MTTVVVRNPDGTEDEHSLESELGIGRGEGNALRLTEGGVSRQHARIYVGADASIYVEDLGSANGTFVDGSPVTGPTPLTADAEVTVGEYLIVLRGVGPKPAALARREKRPAAPESRGTGMVAKARKAGPQAEARAAEEPAGTRRRPLPEGDSEQGPYLKGLSGPWSGRQFPLEGLVSVGRVQGNTLQIDDGSVSRKHAELEVTPDGVILRDAGSANGTLLNGEPMDQEFVLQPGDVIQFGVVEFSFESNEPLTGDHELDLADIPLRREGGSMARRGSRREAREAEKSGGRKTLLVLGGGAVLLMLVGLGLLKTFGGGGPVNGDDHQATPLRESSKVGTRQADVQAQVQDYLTQCRSFAATDVAAEPDWNRAEQACSKALELEPINTEALALVRHIQQEKVAADWYERGQKNLKRLREEEALDFFAKIPEDSSYYRKAKPNVLQAIADVKKKAADDCRRYVRDGHPLEALPRCERYMTYACQDMITDQLRPPVGYKLNLGSGRVKKREWRPRDGLYLSFLRTRAKVTPGAEPWQCPVVPIAQRGRIAEPPESFVKKALIVRFPERIMQEAMMNYWRGAAGQAIASLQRLREDMRYATLHQAAEQMRKAIATVDQLYKNGEGALQADDPERAAEFFDEALVMDQTLMVDQAVSRPSFYRQNIQRDMAATAYARGKSFTDRRDIRRGCAIFRLGLRFSGGNLDLNRIASFCSEQASQLLNGAHTCKELDNAVELAMEGDGLKERALPQRQRLKCPLPTLDGQAAHP